MKTRKAISEMIAIVMMVALVVGLMGTVYFFITGLMGRQTAGLIQPISARCDVNNGRIEILASNEGTTSIPESQIRVFIGGNLATRTIYADDKTTPLTGKNINATQSFWIVITNPTPQAGQVYRGMIVYGGKSAEFTVVC